MILSEFVRDLNRTLDSGYMKHVVHPYNGWHLGKNCIENNQLGKLFYKLEVTNDANVIEIVVVYDGAIRRKGLSEYEAEAFDNCLHMFQNTTGYQKIYYKKLL